MSMHKATPTFSLQIDRDKLVDALALFQGTVPRGGLPIMNHLLLKLTKRGNAILEMIGTDHNDVRIRHLLTCTAFGKFGEFTLPYNGLMKSVSQLPRGDLVIEVFPKDNGVVIESANGSGSLRLETMPPADFPEKREFTPTASYAVKAGDLHKLIDSVRHAVNREAGRYYYLSGAYFQCLQDGVLRAVTTDGHRMVINECPAKIRVKNTPPVIVPEVTLLAVRTHCKAFPGAVVDVKSATDGISFDFGLGRIIHSRVIDGTYPDYQRVIPVGNDKLALFDANELGRALKQFCGKKNVGVRIALKANLATLTQNTAADNANGARVSLKVPCKYTDAPLDIAFTASYLRDALSVLGETVGFAFADPGSPALIMSSEYPQVVVMPRR